MCIALHNLCALKFLKLNFLGREGESESEYLLFF